MYGAQMALRQPYSTLATTGEDTPRTDDHGNWVDLPLALWFRRFCSLLRCLELETPDQSSSGQDVIRSENDRRTICASDISAASGWGSTRPALVDIRLFELENSILCQQKSLTADYACI
jgi:hypothetical protein